LLPKSGRNFDEVTRHLRAVHLPASAAKYAALEKQLINYKVELLLGRPSDTQIMTPGNQVNF
jgi:hypothetical protein